MDKQRDQTLANIQRQQPINPVESTSSNQKSTLDQRIQTMQSMAIQVRKPTQSLLQSAGTEPQKTKSATTRISHPTLTEESTTSQSTSKYNATAKLPILQLPKNQQYPSCNVSEHITQTPKSPSTEK